MKPFVPDSAMLPKPDVPEPLAQVKLMGQKQQLVVRLSCPHLLQQLMELDLRVPVLVLALPRILLQLR